MIKLLKEVEIALLIIFNAGIVARTIKDMMSSKNDEEKPSPMKIFWKNLKVAIVVNLIGTIIYLVKHYYS